jgi:excisionase family DNA binding protein
MQPVREETRDLLTVPEVARLLRVAESTVRKWISAGRVPFLELPGGEYRIPRAELIRSLRGNVDMDTVLRRVEASLQRVREAELADALAEVRATRSASRG